MGRETLHRARVGRIHEIPERFLFENSLDTSRCSSVVGTSKRSELFILTCTKAENAIVEFQAAGLGPPFVSGWESRSMYGPPRHASVYHG